MLPSSLTYWRRSGGINAMFMSSKAAGDYWKFNHNQLAQQTIRLLGRATRPHTCSRQRPRSPKVTQIALVWHAQHPVHILPAPLDTDDRHMTLTVLP
jgi:hypothetical protein